MRNFWGWYCNGSYRVGLSGTVWVYDMSDQLVGRFQETPYTYYGAFVPGTNQFVTHTNENHLVIYDLDQMQMRKKIRTTTSGVAEGTGFAFSNDGKLFYCVQSNWKGPGQRLVVYDTESFSAQKEYFDQQDTIDPQHIEIEPDGTCYVLFREWGEDHVKTGEYVGIFLDGIITEKRIYQDPWLRAYSYFDWKLSGFTNKAYRWASPLSDFDSLDRREPSSLKKLFACGHL